VRVVPGDARAQPDHLRRAEGIPHDALESLASHPGIADLHDGIEVALLGGEQGPAAVHVDAAALENDGLPFVFHGAQGNPEPA
jgi:hypothetical protein